LKYSMIRFINVWFSVAAFFVAAGLVWSLYSSSEQEYLAKGLDNTHRFAIKHAISEARELGAPVAFSMGFIYILARRLTRNRRRLIRTVIIVSLLGSLILGAGAWWFNMEMTGGMNKLYGQYVDVKTFAIRAVAASYVSAPKAVRVGLVFILAGLIAVMSFLAAFMEKTIFRKKLPDSNPGKPRHSIWVISLAIYVGVHVWAGSMKPTPPAPDLPDIIFISIDTLRADHMSCYGYERLTTPNLDRLAEESILVKRHISHSPWTLPAHMSMFSGMIPSRHGVSDPVSSLRPSVTLVTEVLKNKGYRTGGFATNILLGSNYGFAAGFDNYQVNAYWNAEQITNTALRWFGGGSEPTFLFVHLFDPHFPYTPKKNFKGRFHAPNAEVDKMQQEVFYAFFNWMQKQGPEEREAVVALYDEEIAYADWALGRFFHHLSKSGRFDNAWVIVTSDHGEEFGERGMWGHGITLYDEMLHVPLIVKAPNGLCGGTSLDERIVPQNAMFSLLALAGRRPVEMGRDLSCADNGVLKVINRLTVDGPVIAEVEMLGPLRYAAMTTKKKLIDPMKVKAMEFEYTQGMELFDLENDPGEKTNLLAGAPREELAHRVRESASKLHRTMCRTRMEYAGKAKSAKLTLSEATIQKLKSLGYISDSGELTPAALLDENCMPVEVADD
jgi:Sulfatase